MSKLTPRKFSVEDFKDQQGWIGKLLSPLNDFFNQISQSFNNGLTIDDNFYQEIKEIKFRVDSSTYPLKFKTKFPVNPRGMSVIYCQSSVGGNPTAAPWISWSYSGNLVTITNIFGLTTGQTYSIRILVIYA